jgi:hypothetical protein
MSWISRRLIFYHEKYIEEVLDCHEVAVERGLTFVGHKRFFSGKMRILHDEENNCVILNQCGSEWKIGGKDLYGK